MAGSPPPAMPLHTVTEVPSPKARDRSERAVSNGVLADLGFDDVVRHLQWRHEVEVAALRAEIERLQSAATAAPGAAQKSAGEDGGEARERPDFQQPKVGPAAEAQGLQPEGEVPSTEDLLDGQTSAGSRSSPSSPEPQAPEGAPIPASLAPIPATLVPEGVQEMSGRRSPMTSGASGSVSDGQPASDRMTAKASSKKVQSKRAQLLSKYSAADMKDERRHKWLANAAHYGEMLVGFVILLNVVFIYVELEYDGEKGSASLGHTPSGWPFPSPAAFTAMSTATTLFFTMELILKLIILRSKFFMVDGSLQRFNCFDAFIVLIGAVEQFVLTPLLGSSGAGSNVESARLVRILRLARTLRIVRTLEMFSKLRVLLATTLASFYALFWSMVLISVVILISAFVLCQSLVPVLDDTGFEEATRSWVWRYYGTPTKSLWTVFEVTYSGGWPQYVRPLVEDVSPAYAFFFVIYISGVTFALFRIITALFLKGTLDVANADTEFVIKEKMREKDAYAQKLRDFFEAADASGDGMVTIDELDAMVQDERIKTYLATLEIDANDTKQLFQMLDDGDEQISIDEFVAGALRLKGQARSQDVVSIIHDCAKMIRQLEKIEHGITINQKKIEGNQKKIEVLFDKEKRAPSTEAAQATHYL